MGVDEQTTRAGVERGPGRPREPDVETRILDAAFRLMAQHGFVRMAMDAVAAEAGVSKPTIYRRYPSKVELAVAAVIAYCDQEPVQRCGETRADLVAQMRHFRRALDRPFGMAMIGTVLAEEFETPELLAVVRRYLVQPRREALHTILAHAAAQGELRPGADLHLAVNMLVGAYYAQYLSGDPFEAAWSEAIVDAVLAAIRLGPGDAPPGAPR